MWFMELRGLVPNFGRTGGGASDRMASVGPDGPGGFIAVRGRLIAHAGQLASGEWQVRNRNGPNQPDSLLPGSASKVNFQAGISSRTALFF
jgi:hypothetical protein